MQKTLYRMQKTLYPTSAFGVAASCIQNASDMCRRTNQPYRFTSYRIACFLASMAYRILSDSKTHLEAC